MKNSLFIVSTFMIGIHQVLEKIFHVSIPILDNYGDDFFAMPFILTIFSFEQRYIWKRINRPLDRFEIFAFTLFFGLFFEEILPNYHNGFTKDYWDYLAYGLGSLAFYLSNRKSETV